MGTGKTTKKITAVIALTLAFVSVFALLRGYSDTVSAPFIGVAEWPRAGDGENPPGGAGPPGSPAPAETPPAAPAVDEYVIIKLNASDVGRGSLLLINHDHYYEIPDDNDLIRVFDAKTMSYMVADRDIMLDATAVRALNVMMDAYTEETGRDNVVINSGFRDYAKQREILDDYIKLAGPVDALKWASPPGHSEHHSGLALDFGLFSGGTVRTFTGTGLNEWFKNNSWQYGFILRYSDEKTSITGTYGEPWHFRYTGVPHSVIINENDWCYEEYFDFITGFTYDGPYGFVYGGSMYEIYHTEEMQLKIPFDCEFDYSGDNINGFIVTIRHISPVE